MRTARSLLPLVLAVLLLSACSATRQTRTGADGSARVRVVNQSPMDMRIHVVTGAGLQARLGMVNALAEARFDIPSSVVSGGRELSFLVQPLASRTDARSFSIMVRPGQTVTLTIPSYLR
jgi:hypothetical protein